MADIGCDHGYVAISALKSGMAEHAIAADVAKGPLDIAAANCRNEGVGDRTTLILSDGFKAIPDDADINCAVIAGMGGLLMERILREAGLTRFKHLKQLVLSPQSDLDAVRRYLIDESGFVIRTEYMVLDEGKYYYIMDVRMPDDADKTGDLTGEPMHTAETGQTRGALSEYESLSEPCHASKYSESEYLFGRNIAPESGDIYMDFLKHRKTIVTEALGRAKLGESESARDKADKLRTELHMIEEAESKMF